MSRDTTILFVPCFNERGRIGPLLSRIAAVRPAIDELLLVDDGSTDGSPDEAVAAAGNCTILRHRRRSGLGEAFRTAYRHALAREHAVFCVMAGNGKDDPADLGRVLGPVQAGEADFVQGSRFHPGGGKSERLPLHRRWAIKAFTRGASALLGGRFTDCSNGFRAYRTALLTDPRIDWCAPWLGSSYQVEIYLLVAAARHGYRVVEVPTSKIYPADGRAYSKASAGDWFRMLKPLAWNALGLDRVTAETRRAPGNSPAGLVEVVQSAAAAVR